MSPQAEPPYYVVPNLRALDPTAREVDLTAHSWIQATIIEDEDLMFGGKSLSTWYEEDRQRLSGYMDEEQRRGRTRVRTHHYSSHHQHGHSQAHYSHHHHSKNHASSEKKN